MAKKAKGPDDVVLFPDFRRRHAHLILPKLLTEKATAFPFDDARLKNGADVLLRWSDLAAQGAFVAAPQFWVSEADVLARRDPKPAFMAIKDVTSPTNQRTMIASFIP